MFGWLKSLFGSEPAPAPVVPPPLPVKEKKVAKKADKPAVKEKVARAPRKKREAKKVVLAVEAEAVTEAPVTDAKTVETAPAPKKKGGRTKKVS